ncbi:putative 2'-deoxynucleoside 5'-phosphate N-hydrolase 1 isoform X2 [Oratosquilla oratoria]|uniref:putative 2'-deoxynucleoside 5'-phosphate N-hydrolase 1 isoform X2 n=1 Tax=Oratosquilla oratoria TaxID=337810 RepID=UPI003F7623B6
MSFFKIYFCGSIRAGRDDVGVYQKIVDELKKYGEVLTPHVADPSVTAVGGEVIVAEVTQPSLGVGYELGRGVEMKKKILCMYRPQPDKKLSAMIAGAKDGNNFYVENYKEENIAAVFETFFKNISPPTVSRLDWSDYYPM